MQYSKQKPKPLHFAEVSIIGILNIGGIIFTPLLALAVIVGLVFASYRVAVNRQISRSTPVDRLILFLSLFIPLNFFVTPSIAQTLTPTLQLLAGIALFYAFAHLPVRLKTSMIEVAIVSMGICLAIIGVLVGSSARFSNLGLPVDFSQIFNANIIAGVIGLFIPFTCAFIIFDSHNKHALAHLVRATAILLMGASILLLSSRGMLLAAGVSVLILVGLKWWQTFITLPLLALLALIGRRQIAETLFSASQNGMITDIDRRIEIWSRAIYMLEDFALTGVGFGNFGEIADTFYPFFIAPPNTIPHAHNLWLQIGADFGLPMVVIWMAIFLVMVKVGWQLYSDELSTSFKSIGAGLMGAQVVIFTHGLIDAPLWGTRVAVLVWFIWGIGMYCFMRSADAAAPHPHAGEN